VNLGRTALEICLCVFVASAFASPVIDDAVLEDKFAAGLTESGIDGMSGKAALAGLSAADGKKLAIAAVAPVAGADYERLCRSVVVVGSVEFCKKCDEAHMGAISTGWIIEPRGRIVTNYHVLEDKDAGELGVMTSDGEVYAVRAIMAADREGDAAVVEVDPRGIELSALSLAREATTGESVRVVGHPDGRFYSLTEGIVSRIFREPTTDEKDHRRWLTVTADYGGGSSGAPVLNTAGEVVGMVSSTATLLADTEEGKKPEASDVQMVFRDCVSIDTMRRLIAE